MKRYYAAYEMSGTFIWCYYTRVTYPSPRCGCIRWGEDYNTPEAWSDCINCKGFGLPPIPISEVE